MSKHALIGGGTGFIGSHLTKFLQQKGYDVTVISRMPGLRHMTWHDLAQKGIPKDINAVVNLAGQNVLDPSRRWTEGFKQNVWNSRINSSSSLAKAVASAPQVKSFVNIVGVSHYRPDASKVYTEQDKVQSFDYMSNLCMEWEKAATLSAEALKHSRNVLLRTGVVVGRGGGMIQSIEMPFKMCVGGPLGSGKQVLPWIHLEDLCRLIQYAIECDRCNGPMNAVAPEIVTNGEFSKAYAKALRRPCLFAVPEFVVEAMFGKDRAALLLSGAKICPEATQKSGFEYKYPTASAACQEIVGK